jgi:predicted ester cyclase
MASWSARRGRAGGRVEIERIYRVWFTAFPDLIFTTEDLLIDENRVAQLCRVTGNHAGEFFGMPPTGRRIEVASALIYRLENGFIVHERRILDFTGLLVQVGVLRAKPAG